MTDAEKSEIELLVDLCLNEKKETISSEVAKMIANWANHLFCDKEDPWDQQKITESFAMEDPVHHLWAVGGLMKIYVERAISENRNISAEEEENISSSLVVAAKELVNNHYDEDTEELVVLGEQYIKILFEIALEVYR